MSDAMILVRMRESELATVRRALYVLFLSERRVLKRIVKRENSGKRTRVGRAGQAMYMADIQQLLARLQSDERTLK